MAVFTNAALSFSLTSKEVKKISRNECTQSQALNQNSPLEDKEELFLSRAYANFFIQFAYKFVKDLLP